MPESDKRALLEFFVGSDRVPIGGLGRLKPKIQSNGPDSDRLPTGKFTFLSHKKMSFSSYLLQHTPIAYLYNSRKLETTTHKSNSKCQRFWLGLNSHTKILGSITFCVLRPSYCSNKTTIRRSCQTHHLCDITVQVSPSKESATSLEK